MKKFNNLKIIVFGNNRKLEYIRRLTKKLTIIVIRINPAHNFANSKPCKHCCNILKYLCVKNVAYTDNKGTVLYEKVKDLDNEMVTSFHRTWK